MITRVAVETARGGDPNKAMELTQVIFDQKPEGTEQLYAYTTQARVYVHQGQDAKAKAIVDDMFIRFKDDPDALVYHLYGVAEEYLLIADNLYKSGRTKEIDPGCQKAMTILDRLLDQPVATKSVQHAWYSMGTALRLMGDYENAAGYYQAVVDQWPDYIYGWNAQYFVGYCYEELKKEGGIDPNVADVNMEMAYRKTIEKYPNGGLTRLAYLKLGDLCFRQKRYPEAANYYEQYQAKAMPNDMDKERVIWDLGWLYEKLGDKQKGRSLYDEMMKDKVPNSTLRQLIIEKRMDFQNRMEEGR